MIKPLNDCILYQNEHIIILKYQDLKKDRLKFLLSKQKTPMITPLDDLKLITHLEKITLSHIDKVLELFERVIDDIPQDEQTYKCEVIRCLKVIQQVTSIAERIVTKIEKGYYTSREGNS